MLLEVNWKIIPWAKVEEAVRRLPKYILLGVVARAAWNYGPYLVAFWLKNL